MTNDVSFLDLVSIQIQLKTFFRHPLFFVSAVANDNARSNMKQNVTIRKSTGRSQKITQNVELRLSQLVMIMIYIHQGILEGVKRYKLTSAKYLRERFER